MKEYYSSRWSDTSPEESWLYFVDRSLLIKQKQLCPARQVAPERKGKGQQI